VSEIDIIARRAAKAITLFRTTNAEAHFLAEATMAIASAIEEACQEAWAERDRAVDAAEGVKVRRRKKARAK
jgi:hypothetical protein